MGKGLFRDPAEWATSSGWISRRRAINLAARLERLAIIMEETIPDEEDVGVMWAAELRAINKKLAPKTTRDERTIRRLNGAT